MRIINLIIAWMLIVAPVMAQVPTKFQTEVLQFGKGSTLLPKELIFDSGDGASNKKLSLDPNDNEFDLNSVLNVIGNINSTTNINATGALTGATQNVSGLSRHQSGVTLGNGANATQSVLVDRLGADTYIKWNEPTQKWVFSNDGTVEKNLGSGSGSGSGGINILNNAGFEDGLGSWTNSGGTFTQQTYTNPAESQTRYARFVATASGQFVETVLTVTPDMLGAGCIGQFDKYASADSASWKTVVLDSSSNILFTQNLPASGSATNFVPTPAMPFLCLTPGQTVKIRLESIAAGTVNFDDGYLGGNRGSVSVGTEEIGSIMATSSVTCPGNTLPANGAAVSRSTFSVLFSKIGITHGQGDGSTTFNVPDYRGRFLRGVANGSTNDPDRATRTAMSTGGNIGDNIGSVQTDAAQRVRGQYGEQGMSNPSSFSGALSGLQNFGSNKSNTSSVGTGWTFFFDNSASGTYKTSGTGTGDGETRPTNAYVNYCVVHSSVSPDVAITSEQSGWFIDANIGGANPTATAVSSSYTEITNGSLDLVVNPRSAPAKIPCTGTNPVQGLTCNTGPVNESLGIVFSPPFTGDFDICFATGVTVTNTENVTFQLVETNPSSQTIIQEGKDRLSQNLSVASGQIAAGLKICGTFYFSSITEKTIRLMYEKPTSSTTTILGDRSATEGQRDIHITVRPSTMNMNRPVLTGDQVTTPGAQSPEMHSVLLSAPGTASREIGEWITGATCTKSGASSQVGTCLTRFANTALLNCWCTPQATATTGDLTCAIENNLTVGSNVVYFTTINGTAASVPVTLFCHGVK